MKGVQELPLKVNVAKIASHAISAALRIATATQAAIKVEKTLVARLEVQVVLVQRDLALQDLGLVVAVANQLNFPFGKTIQWKLKNLR